MHSARVSRGACVLRLPAGRSRSCSGEQLSHPPQRQPLGSPCPRHHRPPARHGYSSALPSAPRPPAPPHRVPHRGAALALFLSLPGADAQLDPDAIRDLFQLTRMEANLAVALASGGSLVEAADRLGIAHNTARAHLRAIFAKTGVRRQSQLVHLLRSGLA